MRKRRRNMLNIFKPIFSAITFSLIFSNSIELRQFSGSWYEAVEHCKSSGSRIASIADILDVERGKIPCRSGEVQNTQYWIGNYYELSNKISVEGCYISDITNTSDLQEGYQSLRECYGLCTNKAKAVRIFSFKNFTGGLNCQCNLNTNGLNIGERNFSECLSLSLPSIKWWKYKIHTNEFLTSGNKTCQTIRCTNSSFKDTYLRDILCGLPKKGQPPDDYIRYVCTKNADYNITTSTHMPRMFSFIFNASISTDSDQRKSIVKKCKAIACLEDLSFETIVTNCISNVSGVMCLNGSGFSSHSNNTPLTTSVSSINVPTYISHQPAKISSQFTEIKTSTEANFKGKNASTSKLVYISSTSIEQITTKYTTKPAGLSRKSSMTFISFFSNSRITSPSKDNIIQSTSPEVLDQRDNDNSTIGLLVGLLVTALVIFVVVVLLVVCRFKRKGPFRNKRHGDDSQKTEFHGPNYQDMDVASNKGPHIVNNSTYEMHSATEIVTDRNVTVRKESNHPIYEMQAATENVNKLSLLDQNSNNHNNIPNCEYAVVIKIRQMNGNTTNQQQSHNEENLDVIENEYDGLNHNRPESFTKNNNTNNIYDTALGYRDESDSTYVTASHVHVVDKDENCVYDHM